MKLKKPSNALKERVRLKEMVIAERENEHSRRGCDIFLDGILNQLLNGQSFDRLALLKKAYFAGHKEGQQFEFLRHHYSPSWVRTAQGRK